MGIPLGQYVLTITCAHLAVGLILLQPDINQDPERFEEFQDSDILEKMVEASKADISAYRDRQLLTPFNPNEDDEAPLYSVYDDDALPPQIGNSAPSAVEDDFLIPDEYDGDTSTAFRVGRRKRSLSGRIDAKVGVLVVVDNAIYRRYLEKTRSPREALAMLRQYYGMVFSMVDQRFGTIRDPELSISVKISGILVSETRQEAGWVEYLVKWSQTGDEARVSANKALKKFIKWLLTKQNLPEYDHAMAFTGYQLVNKASVDLGGLAFVKSICNTKEGNSASIVADPGDFQVVKVATHELGHSLGASHDGDKSNRDCPPDHNYVMASLTTNDNNKLKNAFYFSKCSIRQMKEMLSTEQAACVRDHPVVYYQYNLHRQPPGQKYTADLQCKLIFGKKSEFCETEKMKQVMCGQLWCKDPENGRTCRTHSFLTALPGTDCANNKVCHLGVCQRSPYGNPGADRFQYNRILSQRQATANTPRTRIINKPTFRIRTRPSGSRRSNSRRQNSRRQNNRSNRRRGRGRGVRQRTRRPRCQADQNVGYCTGIIKVNPRACRRKALRKYCCATCALQRRRRRRKL